MAQRLLKFPVFLMFLAIFAFCSGCTKSYRFKWVHYEETNCADRWARDINNEKLKDNIVAYMEKKGVKIYEIEIFTDKAPDTCTDCTCKSGRTIKAKVKRSDLKNAKSEGFNE